MERAYIGHIGTMVSGTFTGAERRRHSKGNLPTVFNNNAVKALYAMWPAPKPSPEDFPGDLGVPPSPFLLLLLP